MTDKTRQSPAETVSHDSDPKVRLLIEMMAAANGEIDATEYRHSLLNYFCDDRGCGTDTFNLAIEAGLIRSEFNSLFETATARLTEAGRQLTKSYRPAAPDPAASQEK